jgi:Predicted integral membrane protein
MKRSKKAALVLMAPAASLLITGCGGKDPALVYGSLQECISAGINSEDQCRLDYGKAEKLHPDVAPKYVSRAECEAEFGEGKCEEAPGSATSSASSGFFMPMMMGFLAGQMLNGAKGAAAQNGLAPSSKHVSQPLYKTRNDANFRTANNQSVGPSSLYSGAKNISPASVAPTTGKVVRRGGFGQVQNTYGSGG